MNPCLAQARSLVRVPDSRRRTAAARFATQLARCRTAVEALPASPARTAALGTLRRHAAAARTLRRGKQASAKAVRRAQRQLRAAG
jgi:hypothetical protein